MIKYNEPYEIRDGVCNRNDCFAWQFGHCTILSSTFDNCLECRFFKTKEKAQDDRERAKKRIKEEIYT